MAFGGFSENMIRPSFNHRPSKAMNVSLSHFIEEAVRAYLLERAVEQAKIATVGMSETELTDLVEEAIQWARDH